MFTRKTAYCNKRGGFGFMYCGVCKCKTRHVVRGIFAYYSWWFLPLFPGKSKIETVCQNCDFKKIRNDNSELNLLDLDSHEDLLKSTRKKWYYFGIIFIPCFVGVVGWVLELF